MQWLRVADALISPPLADEPVVIRTRYPGTQGWNNIQVSTVYLPQVSPGSQLPINPPTQKGWMNSCVTCTPTARDRIEPGPADS